MKLQTRTMGFFAALILLMAATRYNHFGSAVALPDASLAVFFLAGILLPRMGWMALAAFAFLLLEAGAIDYYATEIQGVSDWCITPAYWFLIPTYASLWLGGSWFARQQQNGWRGAWLFAGAAWLSTSFAFLISNASFYLLSGRIGEMGAVEYSLSVAKYYTPYLLSSALYLAVVAALYLLFVNLRQVTSDTARG